MHKIEWSCLSRIYKKIFNTTILLTSFVKCDMIIQHVYQYIQMSNALPKHPSKSTKIYFNL